MANTDIKFNIIGRKIAIARKLADMKQVDLAAAIEVDYGISMNQQKISRIEAGKRPVRDIELDAFCRVLKIHANDLFDKYDYESAWIKR